MGNRLRSGGFGANRFHRPRVYGTPPQREAGFECLAKNAKMSGMPIVITLP